MKNVHTKQRLKTLLWLAFVASIALFISSCKKRTPVDVPVPIEPKPKAKFDSVYFEVGGKTYSAKPDLGGMNSMGNSGYRMKYLDGPTEGMTIYTEYGMSKKGWYAPTDSIYFYCENTYRQDGDAVFKISFSQGFHKNEMSKYGSFYFPNDTRNMLRKGKLSFATDFESTNSKNGVAILAGRYGRTGKPEFDYKEPLTNYPQDDSVFEIINTEQINKNSYLVEAKFELNLYDDNRVKHRVKNGYIRFTLSSKGLFGDFYKQ